MRLAVTGATGFLGRRVRTVIQAAGHDVHVLEGRLDDAAAVARCVEGAEAVVHLAALGVQARDRDWARMVQVNAVAPLALVDAAARAGVRRIVAAGTCLEYRGHGELPGHPAPGAPRCAEDASVEARDPYGLTKAAGGLLLRGRARERGLACLYLRLSSLYGEGDDPAKLLPSAAAAARAGASFDLSPGAQVREWLHVDDAAAAVLAAATTVAAPPEPLVVNVGTGEGIATVDLVRALYRAAGAPEALVRAGARPYRPGEPHQLVMDVARARAALPGWAPRVALDAGLARLLAPPAAR